MPPSHPVAPTAAVGKQISSRSDDEDAQLRNMYMCLFAGAVPAAVLPVGLTQAASYRKRHQRGSPSAHVARNPVTLDT